MPGLRARDTSRGPKSLPSLIPAPAMTDSAQPSPTAPERYNAKDAEPRWQQAWNEAKLF